MSRPGYRRGRPRCERCRSRSFALPQPDDAHGLAPTEPYCRVHAPCVTCMALAARGGSNAVAVLAAAVPAMGLDARSAITASRRAAGCGTATLFSHTSQARPCEVAQTQTSHWFAVDRSWSNCARRCDRPPCMISTACPAALLRCVTLCALLSAWAVRVSSR